MWGHSSCYPLRGRLADSWFTTDRKRPQSASSQHVVQNHKPVIPNKSSLASYRREYKCEKKGISSPRCLASQKSGANYPFELFRHLPLQIYKIQRNEGIRINAQTLHQISSQTFNHRKNPSYIFSSIICPLKPPRTLKSSVRSRQFHKMFSIAKTTKRGHSSYYRFLVAGCQIPILQPIERGLSQPVLSMWFKTISR
jgi:hypothetical protein